MKQAPIPITPTELVARFGAEAAVAVLGYLARYPARDGVFTRLDGSTFQLVLEVEADEEVLILSAPVQE